MWDTAGQERFRTITNSYYRGAHGVIIVYDVTNSASFESIRHWLYDIAEYAPEGVPKLLVGNKSDLVAERAISTDQGQTLAESLGMEFVETSAKTAAGVQRVFLEMTSQVMENTIHRNLDSRRRLPSNSGPTIRIVSRSFLSGQGCC